MNLLKVASTVIPLAFCANKDNEMLTLNLSMAELRNGVSCLFYSTGTFLLILRTLGSYFYCFYDPSFHFAASCLSFNLDLLFELLSYFSCMGFAIT